MLAKAPESVRGIPDLACTGEAQQHLVINLGINGKTKVKKKKIRERGTKDKGEKLYI